MRQFGPAGADPYPDTGESGETYDAEMESEKWVDCERLE